MNPYASNLGSQDPLEVIAGTPHKVSALIGALDSNRVNQAPAPGKWSPREIVCHLADCETVFAFRLRQTLAEDDHVIQPFDQDKWAVTYAAYDIEPAVAVFTAVRNWNVALVRSLKPEAFEKKVSHPERGQMTLRTIVETMAGHDIGHIRQIQAQV